MKVSFFMRRILSAAAVVIAILMVILFMEIGEEDLSDPVSQQIRNRLQSAGPASDMRCGNERIREPALLAMFYSDRNYRPLWHSERDPLKRAEPFVQTLREADREGLQPEDYHLTAIEPLLAALRKNTKTFGVDQRVDLELLLTDAVILYGRHLLNGRADPFNVYPEWYNIPRQEQGDGRILAALTIGDPQKALSVFRSHGMWYQKLQQGLARYLDVANRGGWPEVPAGPDLKPGERGGRVAILRKRLALSGDLDGETAGDPDIFDEALDRALRQFQERHALRADGVLNKTTLAELNVPVKKRIRQIALNMERLRWLPGHLGGRYVFVNVAGFRLDVIEQDESVMNMKIIVGRDEEDQRTFIFTGKISYLEINPYWNVPESIAVNEVIPKVQKNPRYLASQGMRILDGWSENARELRPEQIDWASVDPEKFRYRFRQDPGPKNPLGRIKFMFPNEFSVYLHDTPSRRLFERTRRTFSHGCIRIEKPIDLAVYLLRSELEWSRETLLAEIGKNKREVVKLPEPVPVYIYYLTAWADPGGALHFRKDVYKSDDALEKAMREVPGGKRM